ncbi:MAG: acyl carrier protein [candidate division Zixibacteria bacterium]|nr:acyl carrier protein [candidate division Zixibacteria bacterium]
MPVNSDTVRQELRTFITDSFLVGDETTTFTDTDSFMRHGIIDSTGVLELIAFLEEKYGFAPEDDEMLPANLDSIDNLVNYIKRKTS